MKHRIDANAILPSEMEALDLVMNPDQHPALVDANGNQTALPEAIFQLLVHILNQMKRGHSIVLMPENETLTTQAAANMIGVSRQHLIDHLEAGRIPFHKVGTHRRVYLRDILAFADQRDKKRRTALDELFDVVNAAGKYDSGYTG
ncbi:MAG: helix-turn-helix domain-containing protein [Balneolales bacterium]|nr:helix-turn-helix domain-containing protein [Balneolales bacterium]